MNESGKDLNQAYLISSWSKVEASEHAGAEYIVGAGVRVSWVGASGGGGWREDPQ
jgi:hypothetical protein